MEISFKLEELLSCPLYIEPRGKVCKQLQSEDTFIEKNNKVVEVTKTIRSVKKKSKINLRAKDELKVYAAHLVDIHPRNSARTAALGPNLWPRNVQR